MKRPKRERRCAYCGSNGALTADHVVSRALYPPSKARSAFARITVPACVACNNGWANDEAHFRNVLLLSGAPTPAVHELWEGKARRSFACPDGLKRLRDLIAQMVPVKTPEGDRHMIYPAKERVLRIVRKIVRGLCHYHGLLSPVHDGQVLADIQRFALPPEFLAEMISAHAEEDVFQYRYTVVDEPELHSGWLLNFYGRTPFHCIVFRSTESRRRLEVASCNTTNGEITGLNG
jgi:hypothetical protein